MARQTCSPRRPLPSRFQPAAVVHTSIPAWSAEYAVDRHAAQLGLRRIAIRACEDPIVVSVTDDSVGTYIDTQPNTPCLC
jgi:hypothetical protein